MWCRVITGGEGSDAPAVIWRRPGGPPVAQPGAPQPLYNDPNAERESTQLEQIDQRVKDAYQTGLREGEAKAAQTMAEQVKSKIEQLSRSIEQLSLYRRKIRREAEPELVRLSLAIARRIMRRELTVDPESILGLLKAGLEKIDNAELYRVRVHPEHAPILATVRESSARPVTIVPDPSLPVGAVVFETSRGSLDVGLETQLQEIERGFADIYPK